MNTLVPQNTVNTEYFYVEGVPGNRIQCCTDTSLLTIIQYSSPADSIRLDHVQSEFKI